MDSEDYEICCEQRVSGTVAFDQLRHELLEVLGTGARISIDILELGSFPSWQGGQ
jgi:hypothetical protein